jgi:hypothetical protein
MFQYAYKGTLIYDVLDPAVGEKARLEGEIRFESRFESGNLQLAIKVFSHFKAEY